MRLALPVAVLVFAAACQRDISIDIVDRPPELDILRPVDGALFDPGQPVFLCAIVNDEDPVEDLSLLLESSVDGVLANTPDAFGGVCDGGNLSIQLELSEAEHALSLTVRDPAGGVSSDSVTVFPDTNLPPSCDLLTPVDDVYPVGEPIDFLVMTEDADDDPSTLSASFESSIDGEFWTGNPDSSGEISFLFDALTPGDHFITLLLSDPRGLTDICSVGLTVDPCLDADGDGFTTCEGDCDDADAASSPDGVEIPDGADNDCDGTRDEGTLLYDDDGDGFSELQGDCDDSDPLASPGATEVEDDGIDQDCNGEDTVSCFVDGDIDGYGTSAIVLSDDGDCKDDGEAETADDCDDTDASINPGAFDLPGDGIDQDCTGGGSVYCHIDVDGDGYGISDTLLADDGDCTDPGEAALPGDCDDADATVNPGAAETTDDGIDQDCNGADAVVCAVDADEDDHGHLSDTLIAADGDCFDVGESTLADDCDDADPDVYPGNVEIAGDGIDQNCDGSDAATCYVDNDNDGHGDSTKATFEALDGDCDDPGEADSGGDCDDNDDTAFPGGTEITDDGVDQDCSGADTVTCYVDADEDGYGSTTVLLATDGTCSDAGESDNADDCDDTDDTIKPGAADPPEDGIDQNCNGVDTIWCFRDDDEDGFGSTTRIRAFDGACDDPGESDIDTDCDDTDDDIYVGASEFPDDGVDSDCNGFDGTLCFLDGDDDSYGVPVNVASEDDDCSDVGEATTVNDCDDDDDSIYPSATETPGDGIDQDCNGVDAITCNVDDDGDDYGSSATLTSLDDDCVDSGEADNGDDCDDTDAGINPAATEVPGNGIDENCDGNDAATCFEDIDGDDFGSSVTFSSADGDCDDPGEADLGGDCDDDDASAYPGGTEVLDNGIDEDCNGADSVQCYVDSDDDGYGGSTSKIGTDGNCSDAFESATNDDCDDGDDAIYPGAGETIGDGIDQDCNGADSVYCFEDTDLDGYGSSTQITATDGDCDDAGESLTDDDCVDNDQGIHPNAAELPGDGVDSDCNGSDGRNCQVDDDGDGYGISAVVFSDDDDCLDGGEATSTDDCDDTDIDINPGATEVPDNGIDEDCSGGDAISCPADADGDGYGDSVAVVTSVDADCSDAGESTTTDDCDDDDDTINPSATDTVGDGIDQNCDGIDGDDEDGDGFASADSGGDDCDDTLDTVNPGATEIRDGFDNNCDNTCDEGLLNEGDIIVTEVMNDPTGAVTDANGEWFEIYNTTGTDIRLCDGWEISDKDTDYHAIFVVQDNQILVPAMDYALLCRKDVPLENGGLDCAYAYTSDIKIANGSDEIRLDFEGGRMDDFDWVGTSPWNPGESMQLDPDFHTHTDNDSLANWCASLSNYHSDNLGTPGAANEQCP